MTRGPFNWTTQRARDTRIWSTEASPHCDSSAREVTASGQLKDLPSIRACGVRVVVRIARRLEEARSFLGP